MEGRYLRELMDERERIEGGLEEGALQGRKSS